MAIEKNELIDSLKSFSRAEVQEIQSAWSAVLSLTKNEIERIEQEKFEAELLFLIGILREQGFTVSDSPDVDEIISIINEYIETNRVKLRELLGADEQINYRKDLIIDTIEEQESQQLETAVRLFLKFLSDYGNSN